jgi:hemolysin III
VIALKPTLAAIAPPGMWLLFIGGVFYTSGVIFYAWRSLPHHHAIWHVFTLCGSSLHYFAVLLYAQSPQV